MARTISEIKNEMTAAFIANPVIIGKYNLQQGKTFEDQFSSVSLESILFYVVATCAWTLEKLFDIFRKEVDDTLSLRKPHRLKWYRDKTLAFQDNYLLPVDGDVYDMIDEEAKVVKYAAAVETPDSSKLIVKIAGGEPRDKLSDETAMQVEAYLNWIKDAGVRIDLVNQQPDHFYCVVDIYYNAMQLADRVKKAVHDAIVGYIENLPFNGEYTNMALTDVLQKVEGVVIPELRGAYSFPVIGDYVKEPIHAKKIPVAGYFRAYEDTDINITMIAYEHVQD